MTEEGKRRGRKAKKLCEKEIMKAYFDGIDHLSMYQNIQHLSPKERLLFEQKFCAPKNNHQVKLSSYLNDVSKKIVIATGPAGTGKTLLVTQALGIGR